MTVGSKLHNALASLEGIQATMKTFALDTDDDTAKQHYSDLAQQLDGIVQSLKGRVNYVEEMEPSYKQFQ